MVGCDFAAIHLLWVTHGPVSNPPPMLYGVPNKLKPSLWYVAGSLSVVSVHLFMFPSKTKVGATITDDLTQLSEGRGFSVPCVSQPHLTLLHPQAPQMVRRACLETTYTDAYFIVANL